MGVGGVVGGGGWGGGSGFLTGCEVRGLSLYYLSKWSCRKSTGYVWYGSLI